MRMPLHVVGGDARLTSVFCASQGKREERREGEEQQETWSAVAPQDGHYNCSGSSQSRLGLGKVFFRTMLAMEGAQQ